MTAWFSIPEFQYARGIEIGINPPDEIQVSDVQAAIDARRQGYRCQQLISISQAITARARDAAAAPVTHDACDDGRLLGHEDVLTTALMKNACVRQKQYLLKCEVPFQFIHLN